MAEISHAIITGASCGIGKAMAIECAKRGFSVILVALPDKILQQTADLISSRYQVPVYTYAIDLTEKGACNKVADWLKSKHLSISMLINNAGIGSSGAFESFSLEFYEKQIYLNAVVPTILTRLLLGELKKHDEAYIMNVASLGGYFHLPDKNVYSATKSFMISFSHSLDNELIGSGVHVSVLCPGPVDTNERVIEINKNMGWIAKKLVLCPESVASIAIKRLLRKRRVIIPGLLNKVLLAISKMTPYRLKRKLIANERRDQVNEIYFPRVEAQQSVEAALPVAEDVN